MGSGTVSYGRIDDGTPWRAKVREASWACRGVIGTAAIPYCSGGETDGILLPAFERDLIYGRDGKRGFREAIERGFIHRAGELCERCLAALRRVGTEPPSEGWYLHDYLQHNPSKSDINRRRTEARERQRNVRADARQPRLDWDQPDLSRVTSPPQPLGGEGEVQLPTEQQEDHARPHAADLGERINGTVGEVLAILARAPRFQFDPTTAALGVESAIAAHLDKDPIAAAHTAVVWVSDPAFRKTSATGVFLDALRKQEPAAERATVVAGQHPGREKRPCARCRTGEVKPGYGAFCEQCSEAVAS